MRVIVEKQYVIVCKYCLDCVVECDKKLVTKHAKEKGWSTHKGENICPDCKTVLRS